MMPWALSFVAIWLREGGPRGGYSSFPYATFGPNQMQRRRRRYKTRIYHVRRRFTTNIMTFDCTTDSTVTWAGTIDCQRTPFTKARVPSWLFFVPLCHLRSQPDATTTTALQDSNLSRATPVYY